MYLHMYIYIHVDRDRQRDRARDDLRQAFGLGFEAAPDLHDTVRHRDARGDLGGSDVGILGYFEWILVDYSGILGCF